VSKVSENRANAGDLHQSEKKYFRINYYFTFLDETISHMKQRFPNDLKNALLASYLVPLRLHSLGEEEAHRIKDEFKTDMPDLECFD